MKFTNKLDLQEQLKRDADVFLTHAQEAVSQGVISFKEYDYIAKAFNYSIVKINKINGDNK
jgi:hypothetical protein